MPNFPNREQLRAAQLQGLRALLHATLPANKFWQRKFANSGIDTGVASLEAFIQAAPLVTKAELIEDQRAAPPFGVNLNEPRERYTRFSQTSGTAGQPLRWADTDASWSWMVDNWVEVFEAAEVERSAAVFFAFSFGPFLGFWTAFEAAQRRGNLCIPGGGMSSTVRLKNILDLKPAALCCTPTYALRLAEVAAAEGFDLSKSGVRTLIVAGESGGSVPAVRARLEAAWAGARVRDHHGMTEVGPVSIPCSTRPDVLHILEARYLAEVLDPQTLKSIPPGGAGELILTPLGRTGMPLFRYRTGDWVRRAPDEVCACGRHDMAIEGGILGRTDDMLCVRGVNVYPSAVEDLLRACVELTEYRVRVRTERGMTELAIDTEFAGLDADDARAVALARALEEKFRAAFALRVPIAPVAPGSLPRFEMKARRWVREAAPEAAT